MHAEPGRTVVGTAAAAGAARRSAGPSAIARMDRDSRGWRTRSSPARSATASAVAPTTGHAASPLTNGYVEQEFFFQGTARDATRRPRRRTRPGSWCAGRRDPKALQRSVVLDWTNVTVPDDTDVGWLPMHTTLMTRGFAYVAVAAQRLAIEAPDRAQAVRPGALRLAVAPRRRLLLRHLLAGRRGRPGPRRARRPAAARHAGGIAIGASQSGQPRCTTTSTTAAEKAGGLRRASCPRSAARPAYAATGQADPVAEQPERGQGDHGAAGQRAASGCGR